MSQPIPIGDTVHLLLASKRAASSAAGARSSESSSHWECSEAERDAQAQLATRAAAEFWARETDSGQAPSSAFGPAQNSQPAKAPADRATNEDLPPTLAQAISSSLELPELMEAVRNGSETAVWQIIEMLEPHIYRIVRHRLQRRMRVRYDSIDFVQMVWHSFFRKPAMLNELDTPGQLFNYLIKMASNKVLAETRRNTGTQRADMSREQPLLADDQESELAAPRQESPSQVAIARERWETMMRGLTEREPRAIRLRLSGRTFQQIADELSWEETAVRRLLKRVTSEQF